MHDEQAQGRRPRSDESRPASRSDFDQAWRRRFVEFANGHEDDAGIAGWSRTGLEARFRYFRSAWRGAAPNALYIDVGCGAGTYARWLDEQGVRVVGVDYSETALRKAMARAAPAIAFCAADATRLPFADASVDGVLCLGVVQAIHASGPLVRELARVLGHRGILWIDGLNRDSITGRYDRARRWLRDKPMHLRYESAPRLLDLVARAGFANSRLDWLPLMPSRLRLLQAAFESRLARGMLASLPGLGSLVSHSFLIRAERRR